MDANLENTETMENVVNEESQEDFDQLMRDLWGDDYTPDDEGADPENGGGDPVSTDEGKDPDPEPTPAPAMTVEQVEERIAQERQKAVDAFIAQQFGGQVNPYTGKPITTAAELEAYRQQYAQEQLKSQLEGAGLDKSVIENLIAEHPAVKQAQEVMQKQEVVERENFTRDALQRLNAKYPDSGVKSLADLGGTAEGRQALEYWRRGIPLEQAYGAAFADVIAENRVKAAKQQVRNDVVGKTHLSQPKGGTSSSDDMIPRDELPYWRNFYPGKTDAQLNEIWRKNR